MRTYSDALTWVETDDIGRPTAWTWNKHRYTLISVIEHWVTQDDGPSGIGVRCAWRRVLLLPCSIPRPWCRCARCGCRWSLAPRLGWRRSAYSTGRAQRGAGHRSLWR